MAQPQAYNRKTDFTERDGDDTNHAGVNTELDAAALSINEIRDKLALIQRDDGALKNGIVTAESLSDSAFNAVLGEVATATAAASAAADRSVLFSTQSEVEKNAAQAAAQTAAALLDNFDDRYLGSKTTNPTTDNDGNPLITGALYFNSVAGEMRVWAGTFWKAAGSSVNGTINTAKYTATAGQTTFAIVYDVGFVHVYLNGVKLESGVEFTANNGTSVVLATGATAGDVVDMIAFGIFSVANTYTKAEADALLGAKANQATTYTKFELNAANGSSILGFQQYGNGAVQRTAQDKMREWVSVKDFGAVGDGVTDDTAAIQAALNASYNVFIPEAEYVITSIVVRDGGTLFGLGRRSVLIGKSTATGHHVSAAGTGYPSGAITRVTMRDFLIYSNSIAANCLNIENAQYATVQNVITSGGYSGFKIERVEGADFNNCDAVGANGYGFVSSRSSDSGLSSWITLTDCFVSGAVLGGMLFTDTASVFLTNPKVINCQDFGIKANVSSAKIGNVRCTFFKCEGGDIDSNWNTSIYLSDQTEFVIANTWISGGRTSNQSSLNAAGYGIFLNNCKNGDITNPKIYACGNQGIRLQGTTKDVSVIGGSVVGCGNDAGIYSSSGDYIRIIGTTVLPNDGSGFTQTKGIDIPTGNYHVVTGCRVTGHSSFDYNVNGTKSKRVFNANTDDEIINSGNSFSFRINGAERLFFDSYGLRPGVDNSMYLGLGSFRWKEVWAANATIQTSDANQKTDIVDEPLGLNFINALHPVQYRFIESGNGVHDVKPHHGLIAQDFKSIIDRFGIDHAAYVEYTDENGKISYGLRYTELISSLIKAVQELDAKVSAKLPV